MTEGICFSQAPFGFNSCRCQTGAMLNLCLALNRIHAFYPCLSSGSGITGPASKVTSMSSVASPLCGLPRWQVSMVRVLGSHLLWAAVRSFTQVRSPLTAAWCSGKAPSSVSSVAVWPSRSNHSTNAVWPNRAARCNGETPEASWSYRDTSRALSLGRPQGSLAGHHQHGQLTEAGLLDDPITPAAGSLPASSIPTLTEEEAEIDYWDPSPSTPAPSLSDQFSPCTFCTRLEKLQLR